MVEANKSFEVQCGTVFEVASEKSYRAIVTQLLGEYSVCSQGIAYLEDGREIIVFGGGTTSVVDIKRTLDRWDKRRMSEALLAGIESEFGSASECFRENISQIYIETLEREYPKPPMILRDDTP